MDRLDTAFYPPIEPNRTGMLALNDVHTMYWEQVGNSDGCPIIMLHGGPGGSVKPYYRQIIDPNFYRGILYDQRGCGLSEPFGTLEDNTTQHLVDDIERLREHLEIKHWIVLGGSWGSTLALAYAETYPKSVKALIITGVIMEREIDMYWWWEGTRFVYPEVWAKLRDFLPVEEQSDIRGNYRRRIMDPDPTVHEPAALALMIYEAPNPRCMARSRVHCATGNERTHTHTRTYICPLRYE